MIRESPKQSSLSTLALACALALAGCVLGGVEGDFVPLETPAGDASCGNGALDGSESDVDCGGGCSPCSEGRACASHADCASGLCASLVCAPASCADGDTDGGESDVDCGGPCPGCADGAACATGGDCASGVCTAGACAPPDCGDGVHNGGEVDVDCGASCPPCGPGKACTTAADCAGGLCVGGVCAETCTDGVVDQTETDVDCGGPLCPACAAGASCALADDCLSHVCMGGICQAATCSDTLRSGLETDVDCGGADCAPCANGKACVYLEDCASGGCSAGVCGPWAKGFGPHTGSPYHPVVMSVDPAGDIAMASAYVGGVDFGGGPVTGVPCLVAKLARTGAHLWSRSCGDTADALDVASDASGNVYVAGRAFNMGCGSGVGAVIAKYHATTGACLWQQGWATAGAAIRHVAVAPNGEVAIAGIFDEGTISFGTTTLTNPAPASSNIYHHFIATLDASGNPLWAKDIGESFFAGVYRGGLAVDAGGIIVSHEMSNQGTPGTIDFGTPCAALTPNPSGIYVAKLDAAGTCIWANGYGGLVATSGVATDASGDVLWIGYANGVDFGGGPLGGGFGVVKLAGGTGAHVWSHGRAVVVQAGERAISVDAAGNAIVAGAFDLVADFGNNVPVTNTSTCNGCRDIFVAKYAGSTGDHLFSTTYGRDGHEYAQAVAVHPVTGSVLVAGVALAPPSTPLDLGAPLPLVPLSPGSTFLLSMGPLP